MQSINENMDLFSPVLNKDLLFNISTGRAASELVVDYLMHVEVNGQKLQNKFISDCGMSGDKFESQLNNKTIKFI